jgi:hypothetical protein
MGTGRVSPRGRCLSSRCWRAEPLSVHQSGQFFFRRLDQFVQLPGTPAAGLAAVPLGAELGEPCDQQLLMLIRLAGCRCGLPLKMPAFPTLLRAQSLRALGARRACGCQRCPAWDHHQLALARRGAEPAELHRADAGAMLDGDRPDDITSQRMRHPLGTRSAGSRGHGRVIAVTRSCRRELVGHAQSLPIAWTLLPGQT